MKDMDKLKNAVPEHLRKFPEYRLLLVYAKESDAESLDDLKSEIDNDIKMAEQWLHNNGKGSRLGLKNHLLRAHSKYIDFLKTVKKKFARYL